ncbi:DUF3617 domain-containing protein [Aurantiacibacter rhizosphaerae]|uniref:DUF3617 family protein n=1 Tax=Aurantiacibacter rhizosphaerae TaxID=2691582 RepID=A0A844XFA0_9SPHN|nr:DUF3617 domain-containing protein [Aurantiacibacter rhizosphaerae]MWV28510.1 DUF3617 family protein [Aurantiacibacter rhizosphaerae]
MNRKHVIAGMAAAAIATSAYAIEPGNWEATSRMTDIQLPASVPPQAADMMRQIMGGEGTTVQNCVTQEDLENSPERVFEETNGECRYTEFQMAGGTIHAVAQCDNDQGTMNMTMDGTYTDTTYSMTTSMQGDMGMGPMTMTFDVTGQRLGPCG